MIRLSRYFQLIIFHKYKYSITVTSYKINPFLLYSDLERWELIKKTSPSFSEVTVLMMPGTPSGLFVDYLNKKYNAMNIWNNVLLKKNYISFTFPFFKKKYKTVVHTPPRFDEQKT